MSVERNLWRWVGSARRVRRTRRHNAVWVGAVRSGWDQQHSAPAGRGQCSRNGPDDLASRTGRTAGSGPTSDGALLQPPSLTLTEAAPDAEPLVVAQCVLEALGPDLAGQA